MARGWMPLSWVAAALTTTWLGLAGSAVAQVETLPAPKAETKADPKADKKADTPTGLPPGPAAAYGGAFMGLPCPPPVPQPPCPPPCEGPTDNTQHDVPMFHASFDYLYWYPRKSSLPPVVTAGSAADAMPGALRQAGTRTLLQGTALEDDQLQGLRLTLGVGVDASDAWSLVVSGFALEEGKRELRFSSTTDVIARPYFNLITRLEDADRVSVPGTSTGLLRVSETRRYYGGDVYLGYEYYATDNNRYHLLAGVKLLSLEEQLSFNRTTVTNAGGVALSQSETLAATNRFYGPEIGGQWEFRLGPVFLLTTGKLGLGVTDVNPNLTAFTRTITPGTVVNVQNQGLYVTPNMAGRSHKSVFAAAPELTMKFGFDFNEWVRFSVGYTFMGVTDATRAGDLINRNVNPLINAQPATVTPISQQATTPTTAFWAQGLDVSIRFSF